MYGLFTKVFLFLFKKYIYCCLFVVVVVLFVFLLLFLLSFFCLFLIVFCKTEHINKIPETYQRYILQL